MQVEHIAAEQMTALNALGYTSADLSMLAKTEIEALLAPDSVDGLDPHEVAAAEQEAAAAATAATATTTAPAAVVEEPRQTAMPVLKAEVPADAAEKIKTLRGEERAAFKELMDGTIDAEAYDTIRERVDTESDTLKTQALTASIFDQVNTQTQEQAAQNEWKTAESSAMNTFKGEGLDYRAKPSLLAAYNVNLKALGADPKNEKRDAPWFLAEAHKLTKADLGFVSKSPDQINPRGVDLADLPPTLRTAPAAATGAVNGDEFAHMRNLDGLALERAHAAMTEDQRNRWMAE